MMGHTAETARTAFGVAGNVTTFLLFASPIPTFWRIARIKSAEEFKPDPYIAAVMNCILWVFYGVPAIHPDSTLVITINAVGLLLELLYLTIYFLYTPYNRQRLKIVLFLAVEVGAAAGIAAVALKGFHTHESRSSFVGALCVVFGVILYSSPLTAMRMVVRTRSVEFMPLWLSVAAFTNGVVWSVYALIRFDAYILTGNGIGAMLGAAQLVLYACYFKSTPKRNSARGDIVTPLLH